MTGPVPKAIAAVHQVEGLTVRQHAAIAALLQTDSIAAAAVAAGVGRRSLHRWLREDVAFRTALRRARSATIEDALTRLASAGHEAVGVLLQVARGPAPAAARVTAARALLDMVVRLEDSHVTGARLDELERLAAEQDRRSRAKATWR